MTLNQYHSLSPDEIGMALYIVNVIDPLTCPKIEFEPQQLTWFKHQELVQKLLNSFNKLKPEGHPIYSSLMEKLGVKVEINKK